MSELAARSLSGLKGVGPRGAERLAKLGLHNVEDLLFHLPFRYEDRTQIQVFFPVPEHDELWSVTCDVPDGEIDDVRSTCEELLATFRPLRPV